MKLPAPQAAATLGLARRDNAEAMQRPAWVTAKAGAPRSFNEALHTPLARRDPRREARQSAYDEGMQAAKATVAAIVAKYQQGIVQLEHLRDQICVETEQQLVELALLICREVLQTDVGARQEFTCQMVDHALSMLREAQTITLRLAPADVAAVKKRHPELVAGNSVLRIVEDRACELGGVVAEADLGRIDATIERRLNEVARELLGPSTGAPGDADDELATLLATEATSKP